MSRRIRYRLVDRNAPREMPGYGGRGPSTALAVAAKRAAHSKGLGSRVLILVDMLGVQTTRERAFSRENTERAA